MQFSFATLSSGLGALALVLILVLLAARGVRSAGMSRFGLVLPQARRLSVLDSVSLDRSRRLVIVRCDDREVLLLTGGSSELVVGWLTEAPGAREVSA